MRVFIFFFLGLGLISAQKTLQLNEGQSSPEATLEDVQWLTGHWKGEAFGGITEEIWSPPMGNSMMFVFRLINDGKVSFYEAGHILEQDNTLILQLKHFHGNLHGWEEKDETVDFKLVKIDSDVAYFEGFTIKKISANAVTMHVLVSEKGKEQEVAFAYQRVD